MLPPRFLLKNYRLLSDSGKSAASDLLVENGKVQSIDPAGTLKARPEDAVLEGEGDLLVPLGIDLQIHLRYPGQPEKETPDTGLRAALRGGIGAVVTMPNTKPVLDTPEALRTAVEGVRPYEDLYGVKVFFSVAMTLGQAGLLAVDAGALKEAGAVALTDDGRGVANDEVMAELFRVSAESGLPLLQHAEVPGHGAHLAAGPVQKKLGLKAYPAEAESAMIERDLKLLAQHPGARYHVLHLSSVKSLDVIKRYKDKGLVFSCEVTPHHLYFSSDDIQEGNTNFKMNPPLRSPADRKALVEGLDSGLIDCMSTDHAPHEGSRKGPDFEASAFGCTGLETSFRVLLTLCQRGELRESRLNEVFSGFATRFLNLNRQDGWGSIMVGQGLKAAAWRVTDSEPVQLSDLESLSKNNCFLGAELRGKIRSVFNEKGLFRF